MSSNAPVPVPRTAVVIGAGDPVEQARAELKAALAAIEQKANIPRRVSRATDRGIAQARTFVRRNPSLGVASVVAGAVVVGTAVWALVRVYTR